MITKIELTNFMSHAHTVIEPAAGLTVLVGANNVGKSAVVAALQIVCSNERADYAIRHDAKACSVKVETDDGHVIEWRRKNAGSYVIDGQDFDRLGQGGTPEKLQPALRLPKVQGANNTEFDVHFGSQKSPIFLLGGTGGARAQFFASSSDASRLIQMQKRHRDKLSDAQKEKARLEAESRQLDAELALLEPVVELDRRLGLVEATYQELVYREDWLASAAEHERAMRAKSAELASETAKTATLAALAQPPDLVPVVPLERLIADMTAGQAQYELALARTAALAELVVPPPLADEKPLEKLIDDIAVHVLLVERGEMAATALRGLSEPPQLANELPLDSLIEMHKAKASEAARWTNVHDAVASLSPPPVFHELRPLTESIAQMESAAATIVARQAELDAAKAEFGLTAEALRAKAKGNNCPVCGSPLDPDRLIARAETGGGIHDHE